MDGLIDDRNRWIRGIDGALFARGSDLLKIAIESPEYKEAQAAVNAEPWTVDPGYFRANIWGMGQIRDWMSQGDMWDEEAEFADTPVDLATFGLTEEEAWGEISDLSEEKQAAYEKMSAASDARMRGMVHQAEDGGIPPIKLSDNSGWWVTPDEIVTALAKLRNVRQNVDFTTRVEHDFAHSPDGTFVYSSKTVLAEDPSGDAEWFATWVQFLERAAKHEGFRVY